jgi:hypothetical protein
LPLLQDKYAKLKIENAAKGEALRKINELSSSSGVLDPASPSERALSASEYDDMDVKSPVGSVLSSSSQAWSEYGFARNIFCSSHRKALDDAEYEPLFRQAGTGEASLR